MITAPLLSMLVIPAAYRLMSGRKRKGNASSGGVSTERGG